MYSAPGFQLYRKGLHASLILPVAATRLVSDGIMLTSVLLQVQHMPADRPMKSVIPAGTFHIMLRKEIAARDLTERHILHSQFGYEEWEFLDA